MILLLTLGLILIGVLIGGAGMRRAGQFARRIAGPWRPGIGVGALICLFAAAALASRGALIEAAALAAIGFFLALGARLPPAREGFESRGRHERGGGAAYLRRRS